MRAQRRTPAPALPLVPRLCPQCWGKGQNGVLAQGRGTDIGDGRMEVSKLRAINIGTGVVVATAPILTLSPTGAPTVPRTPAPSVPPTGVPVERGSVASPRGPTPTAAPEASPSGPTPSPTVASTAGDFEDGALDDRGANDNGTVDDVAVNSAGSNGKGRARPRRGALLLLARASSPCRLPKLTIPGTPSGPLGSCTRHEMIRFCQSLQAESLGGKT